MPLAICGDLHVGRLLYGYDLTPSIRQGMYEFLRFSQRRGVQVAVQLGDVFDRPRPALEHEKLVVQWCNEFERAGIRLYLLAGNHDAVARDGITSALEVVKAMRLKHVVVVDRPMVDSAPTTLTGATWDRTALMFLPFPSPSLYPDVDAWYADIQHAWDSIPPRQMVLVFSHLNVEGADLGKQEWVYRGGEYDLPEVLTNSERVWCVVNGHIHKQGLVHGKVHLVGAAQRLRFDEAQNPVGFGLIEDDDLEEVRVIKQIAHRLRLHEETVDASAWGNGGAAPSTQEIVERLGNDWQRCFIKVQPIVDEHAAVDWSRVEAHLYRCGAQHVVVASPVLARRKTREVKAEGAVGEPTKAAKFFLRTKIKDEAERREVYRRFLQIHAKVTG